MPTKEPMRQFQGNTFDYLNALRHEMGSDYQARIPSLTKENLDAGLRALDNYYPGQNAIIYQMINKVGLTQFNTFSWHNKLGIFKSGKLEYGESVEEIQLGLIQSRTYDTDRESGEKAIFGRHPVESNAWYHTAERAVYYPITVDDMGGEIRKAFHTPTGLQTFIDKIFGALHTSNEYDEFMLMVQALNDYEQKGGYFRVNVPEVSSAVSSEAEARALLRAVREYVGEFGFPNRNYNVAKMPSVAYPDELVLIVTPQIQAALDVEGLAPIFHIDKAEVPTRIITVPKHLWNIPGAQAVLTTENFWRVYDKLNTITQSENPTKLYHNYFLHVQQIMSYSLAVPAVLFTTEAGTIITAKTYIAESIGELTIVDEEGATVTEVERGKVYDLTAEAVVTPDDAGADKGVGFRLVAPGSSQTTRVGVSGVLLVGYDEVSEELKVEMWSALNPDVRKEVVIPVTGEILDEWPIDAEDSDGGDDGDGDGGGGETPPAPVVNSTDGTEVTGTGVAGATVMVQSGSAIVGTGVVDVDGTFTITLDPVQETGTVLSVTQTVEGVVSEPATVTVT